MTRTATAEVINDDVNEDVRVGRNPNPFFDDVVSGLSADKKSLSPKYFYDEKGSKYFDQICELEEYYPYQTELKLLPKVANALREIFYKPVSIVEFGAGSLIKIRPILQELKSVCEFIPIDISGEHLFEAAAALKAEFPKLHISPEQGDFCQPISLETFRGDRVGFFPGSTIGNFTPDQAKSFLRSARETLGKNSYMLIGVDTKKAPELLHSAYNDRLGVTAKFNLNMLARINRELDGDFDLSGFSHYAYYNPVLGRIEMHLVSAQDQKVSVGATSFFIQEGETIHTECSYKYSPSEFQSLAESAGWSIHTNWMAEDNMFSMYLMHAE